MGKLMPDRLPGKYFLDYAARSAKERYCYHMELFPRLLARRLLRPEWHASSLGMESPSQEAMRLINSCDQADHISPYMYWDMIRYLPMDILVKVDRMTMAHSLEARPPLLDHEFVEYVASIPVQMKLSENGRQKHVFKEAVRPYIPDALVDRKKQGFSVPLRSWFKDPLAPLFQDLVLDQGHCTKYLEPSVIQMLFDENRRGRRDHGFRLWAILVLEFWLRNLATGSRATITSTNPLCHQTENGT